jgi:tetratricopeptide (TPR) repeat protein
VALSPPRGGGLTVEGRPLLNLSLALNYAVSGLRVWSYHGLNLAIHLLAGLTLLGIVRRTLVRLDPSHEGHRRALGFAVATALLWTVHPLQTESVTYIIQRAESLMGFCYLLTLYGFIRSLDRPGGRVWPLLAVAACAAGMATKEVMVSAPLIVLAYDRAFVAGSWRAAWRARRTLHLALGATWLVLAFLVMRTGNRGGTSGIGSGVAPWDYWLTQPGAIARYLRLSFWPAGQVFDYGPEGLSHPSANVGASLLLLALAVLTGRGLLGAHQSGGRWGFLGLVFFAVLAPTSLVPGNRQTLAEHRMYLALAPVVIAVLAVAASLLRRASSRQHEPLGRGIWVLGVAALTLVGVAATRARNADYRSPVALFALDAGRRPANAWAQANLGMAWFEQGQMEAAVGSFREALRLRPVYPLAEDDLGNALLRLGRRDEAEACFRRALREDPHFAAAHNNLGRTLLEDGDAAGAAEEIAAALKLDPGLIEARNNWAGWLARSGRLAEAAAEYRAILAAQPDNAGVHNDFGIALAQAGDRDAAITQYREALGIDSALPEAHANLADALAYSGRSDEAIGEYRRALALRANFTSARANLGNVLLRAGRPAEARAEYETALRFEPGHASTHYNLGNALLQLGQTGRAVAEYREALRLQPGLAVARRMLEQLGSLP